MQTREVAVNGRAVVGSGDTQLVRTSVGVDQMHVIFDSAEWLEFTVHATFVNGEASVQVSLTLTALDTVDYAAEATCTIPWEVIQEVGSIAVTFHGTQNDGDHIITQAGGTPFTVVQEGTVDPSTLPTPQPTPPDLPIATVDDVGTVKPDGTTITIDSDGTIHSSTYSLPPATTSALGGVKPDGTTITVDQDGTIHGASTYTLPIASTSTLGGVKVDGTTVTVDQDGTIHGASQTSAIPIATVREITGGSGYADGDGVSY